MGNNIKNVVKKEGQAFLGINTAAERVLASKEAYKALDAIQPISRGYETSRAAIANRFADIDGTTSVRDSMSRLDYEFFRPNEQLPKRFRDIMFACNGSYQKIAIVRQVIDLMGDFCSQGIRVQHPNDSIERFYQEWFNHVKGQERSERFCNLLYRLGNVVIKRNTGKLDDAVVDDWKKAIAGDVEFKGRPQLKPQEIPLKYVFINPMVLEIIGQEMAQFTGNVHYALKLPMTFYRSLNLPLSSFDPTILTEGMPKDIQGAMNNNDRYLILDPDKLITAFYKKDDWDCWAYPMLYSILDDLILFEKMKLADLTALDGVISHVRIWKLGSLEKGIIPTDAAINKLASVLTNHVAGGALDFIWGPDLELLESSTDVYKFLGGEKYEAVMAHINIGLGLPSSLSGAKGSYSDNFLSVKTMIEKLKYGRSVLTRFWEEEFRLVQQAMGFRYPARIVFDNMNLNDETAEKALWIQLLDRNVVSIETVQEKFGQIPDIEQMRITKEEARRKKKINSPKVSPYMDAQPELSLEKIALQRGMVTPSQVGLDLPPPNDNEGDAVEILAPPQKPVSGILPKNKKKGVSGEGRPKNSTDKNGRKKRTVKPRAVADEEENGWFEDVDNTTTPNQTEAEFAELLVHGMKLQKAISNVTVPFFLEKFGKKNLRQLTAVEQGEMEKFQFDLLFNIPANVAPTEENVVKALEQPVLVYEYVTAVYKKMAEKLSLDVQTDNGVKSYLYALFEGGYE